MLLSEVGGIKESYNQPDGAFTNNHEFLFIQSLCHQGLGYVKKYYIEACDEKGVLPMPDENLICFAQEANGGQTLYDHVTKQVYLFSHDHAFDYLSVLPGQPEYTFHTINGVSDFKDYVELLSKHWIDYIAR